MPALIEFEEIVLFFNVKRRLGAVAALAAAALLSSCATNVPLTPGALPPAPAPSGVAGEAPPPAPREFRAAWVSTVANIDWPSRSNLTVEKQQAEARAILDRARALNLNAIVLQVRPSADAMYPSKLEPWSEFLTGQQGRAPQPVYDPLQYWVEQAHARGLELHAWFNPYRARHATAKTALAREHFALTNPEAVKQYGRYLWMDPGEAASSQRTQEVVFDVVRRYDIDGVHIDDYFYPYPIDAPGGGPGAEAAALDGAASPRTELEFPDQPSWQRYLLAGGKLERAAWRRENVNQLIEALYAGIHREKNWVRFGISPFGIGRPDRRPPGIAGFSQYDKLYADAELWLAKGWLDYLSPQLYWPIAQPAQAFDVLLDYWLAQNPRGRHVWPGLYTSRIDNSAKAFPPEEIVRQVALTRTRPGANGQVHFSIAPLMDNRKGIGDQLKANAYQSPALVPATPWLGSEAPAAPLVTARREGAALGLKLAGAPGKAVAQYAVWSRYGTQWRFAVVPGARTDWALADDAVAGPVNAVVVSAVDRLGNESERVQVLRAVKQ
ncbi:glycoside hydrolase family 10 protein [Janthinobacterium fluminis]|uniref:Family 10 glycosylhydrolase n=1 Tax=Janthinobacterium fluminis TaxID=2987524 RepID=A0ABT5JYY1_9BURK|nr:family 10 glycosylhydrolase [Janthinobacterium fluminis]MDC8757943.1 family 10 glycosylhydrolase [Janthinobacterium fluminis]